MLLPLSSENLFKFKRKWLKRHFTVATFILDRDSCLSMNRPKMPQDNFKSIKAVYEIVEFKNK